MDTLSNTHHAPARKQRIAVVTMGVKLGDETRGYTRFRFLSELLVREGFDVTLFTSSFQHWEKAQRDVERACYRDLPYRVVFIPEPGYKKNLDLARIMSHRKDAKNLRRMLTERFAADARAFDLIYAEIPPNDVARVCAETAHEHGIPFVADVNDLWPEAMRMVVNVPVVSDIAFRPFARDAHRVYELLSGAVGTSDEYAERPAADREEPYERVTVYVGNNLAAFDEGVRENADAIVKPAGEFWVTYAGTLGASYDLSTLVQAAKLAEPQVSGLRVKILGDGPDRDKLTELASSIGAPVDFLGYTPYDRMAAWLAASDITVNSLVHGAAQSIVTKIGDYLAHDQHGGEPRVLREGGGGWLRRECRPRKRERAHPGNREACRAPLVAQDHGGEGARHCVPPVRSGSFLPGDSGIDTQFALSAHQVGGFVAQLSA